MTDNYPDDHYDLPPMGNCVECDHSEDLPPGVVFGEDDLYCSKHHCAVDPRHTCEEWDDGGAA